MLISLALVFFLIVVAAFGAGAAGLKPLFGIYLPYIAAALFIGGFIYRVVNWASSPVPFRIATTGGQQKSFDWISHNPVDNPSSVRMTWVRMLSEVLLFRTLFRNTSTALYYQEGQEPKVAYFSAKWLWLFALTFHYSFLVVMVRHLRFFTDPVPGLVVGLDSVDSALQMLQPGLYLTDVGIVLGAGFLLGRRLAKPAMRYMSQASDYFPLFLILSISLSGVYMRYIERVDINSIKTLTMGLATFSPVVPDGISVSFYVHLFLVSVLLAYFPFSKLMHFGGVFFSPSRNQANNSRSVHHENPWNPKIPPHSYEAYEDEFREPMAEAGLPLDKPLES